jgi:DNA-binding NtrC family response regulator
MNVLLVEDDSVHAQMIQITLAREGKIKIHWATHIAQARTLLLTIGFQLVLLDYTLPDGTGFDLFYDLRARFVTLPIVFLTALNSAEICAKAFKGGAVDYVVKRTHYLESLPGVVRRALKKVPGQGSLETVGGTCVRCGYRHSESAPAPGAQPDERTLILQALERHHWRRERAARELHISRITLWRRMWKYGLAREGDESAPAKTETREEE